MAMKTYLRPETDVVVLNTKIPVMGDDTAIVIDPKGSTYEQLGNSTTFDDGFSTEKKDDFFDD